MVKYGAALGVFMVALGLFFARLAPGLLGAFGWLFYAAGPVAVALALSAARCERPLSYWRAVKISLLVSLIGASIYALYVYGYNAFIDDSYIQNLRAENIAKLNASTGDVASREAKIRLVELLTSPSLFALSVWVQLQLATALAALVIAALLRKK